MSAPGDAAPPQTVGARIEDLRRSLPPKNGRRSRLGHISIDDLAEAVGTTRTRVIAWTKGRAYPDAKNAEALASLSKGRYTADDFKSPGAANELAEISRKLDEVLARAAKTSASYEARLAKLEEQVDQILALNETSFEVLLASVARIEQLEAARSARPAPRRKRAS